MRPAPGTTRTVRWHAAAGLDGFVSTRAASSDAAAEGKQTTVLHAEQLYTLDGVPVNVVVALHWSIRDAQKAALAASTRSSIKGVIHAVLCEVVSSTMLGALLTERALVELRLCNRLTGALAGCGIAVRSCRIRDVGVPPGVRDSGVGRVLEQLDQIVHRHRIIRRWGT